jgi:hypothetical protein
VEAAARGAEVAAGDVLAWRGWVCCVADFV